MDGPFGMEGPERVAVVLDRDVLLPVVRGLMCLLLKANFSCHTDMFILGCKVRADWFAAYSQMLGVY